MQITAHVSIKSNVLTVMFLNHQVHKQNQYALKFKVVK